MDETTQNPDENDVQQTPQDAGRTEDAARDASEAAAADERNAAEASRPGDVDEGGAPAASPEPGAESSPANADISDEDTDTFDDEDVNTGAPAIADAELDATAVDAEATAAQEPVVAVSETPEGQAPAGAPAEPEGPKRAWYVVHCYSGYENKVKKSLEQRINNMDVDKLIFRIIVPTEEEIDVREGQRKVVQRRVFPGYVLVEMMQYDPENPDSKRAWYVVRNTPGVTGFVSSGDIPTPLREAEVTKILKRMETDQPKVRVTYRKGQVVHIIDGPFADFRGTVDEVNMEKGKVRVMVSFFGRETPVELDLLQVEKV